MIEFESGTIQVGAEEIAPSLQLAPEEVMQGIRGGTITSLCEQGREEDAGRHRLTFYSVRRSLRPTVDAGGTVLKRSAADCAREMFGLPLDRGPDHARQSSAPARPEGGTK